MTQHSALPIWFTRIFFARRNLLFRSLVFASAISFVCVASAQTNNARQANRPSANTRTGVPARNNNATKPANQTTTSEQKAVGLFSGKRKGSCDVVEVSLEGAGDLLQTNASGQYERSAIEFIAGFKYEERYDVYSPNGPARSIRQYEQAGMKRKIGASITRPLLDSSRKNIVTTFDGKKITTYSPAGPLKAEQWALLNEVPFCSTILERLLPEKEVKLGETWRVSNDILVALLGVDAVENNTLQLTLTSIVDNFAEVEIYQQGGKDSKGADLPSTMECASDGASSSINLTGKFQYDVSARRITWFGARILEQRSESVVAPGLDSNVSLKISVAPLDEPQKLTDELVQQFQGDPKPEMLRLYYNAHKGPWKFQHSRLWKMTEDFDKSTALCYIDRGEAVAQCNILSNGKIDISTQPSLDGYKKEIQKGLGSRFAEFKQEAAYEKDDLSVYYVVADGAYESMPFRWAYYLITDKEGNQATIMFEIRADLLDRYDDSGNEIVESFRFAPRTGARKTDGKSSSETPTSDGKGLDTTVKTKSNADAKK